MAIEKSLKAISPRAFTANGTNEGVITLSTTSRFKVKQTVIITANTLDALELEVKRVISKTQLRVGPKGGKMKGTESHVDLSAYTTGLSAAIYAEEQPRPNIPEKEIFRAVYEEEPTVAIRTHIVDELGDFFGPGNPLPVVLTDGSINIGTVNAELEVQLSHKDNVPDAGDVADSVRIGDGTYELKINADGSINTVSAAVSAKNPFIENFTATLSGTEYSFSFPAGTKRFALKPRTPCRMQLAFNTGETNSQYISILPGKFYEEISVNIDTGLDVFFEVSKPGIVIEIVYWT